MTPYDYLAGPMRGLDQFGFPAFDAAASALRAAGRTVVSPAEHDRSLGFDETKNSLDGFDLKSAILWDLEQVANCDRIVLLPGWEQSSGVRVELALAEMLNKDVAFYATGALNSEARLRKHGEKFDGHAEVRVTSGTGGQKGRKLAELGAYDALPIMELAKVAGFGATKYSAYNYLKGYPYSWSYSALQRHLHAFWSGEDNDGESGLSHLAHAMWHCGALLSFRLRGLGTDDRYKQGG